MRRYEEELWSAEARTTKTDDKKPEVQSDPSVGNPQQASEPTETNASVWAKKAIERAAMNANVSHIVVNMGKGNDDNRVLVEVSGGQT